MKSKKQLNMQAISFSLVLLLSWISFASIILIAEVINILAGRMNTFKYTIVEQLIALIPAVVLIAITLLLNYLLKPDLSQYFKMHMKFGIITNLICIVLLISYCIVPVMPYSVFDAIITYFYLNIFWIVPALSLLIEIGCFIKQRLHQKPKELAVLIVSNTGISLLLTYIVELFIIGSHI